MYFDTFQYSVAGYLCRHPAMQAVKSCYVLFLEREGESEKRGWPEGCREMDGGRGCKGVERQRETERD